jgi:hypothetical protein
MVELGQKLRITYYPVHLPGTKVTLEGKVVFINDSFYTVQFENYKESFNHGDININVEVLDGNKRVS